MCGAWQLKTYQLGSKFTSPICCFKPSFSVSIYITQIWGIFFLNIRTYCIMTGTARRHSLGDYRRLLIQSRGLSEQGASVWRITLRALILTPQRLYKAGGSFHVKTTGHSVSDVPAWNVVFVWRSFPQQLVSVFTSANFQGVSYHATETKLMVVNVFGDTILINLSKPKTYVMYRQL